GVENIGGVCDHRPSELAGFIGRGFGDSRCETFEKLKTVHSFTDVFLDGLARFFFSADNDAAALPALLRHASRSRPIDRVAGNPQTWPANLALLNAFFLRQDPFGGTVVDVGACRHTVGEIKFAHPLPVVAVAINESRQNRLALRIDHLRATRNRDLPPLTDFLDTPALENNYCVFNRRPPTPVDQSAAHNGDGS